MQVGVQESIEEQFSISANSLFSSLVIHGWICFGRFNNGNFYPRF
jgi:hypothetical protein